MLFSTLFFDFHKKMCNTFTDHVYIGSVKLFLFRKNHRERWARKLQKELKNLLFYIFAAEPFFKGDRLSELISCLGIAKESDGKPVFSAEGKKEKFRLIRNK